MDILYELLINNGVNERFASYLNIFILTLSIIIICIIANYITKKVFLKLLAKIINTNKSYWDDVLLEKKFFQRLSQVVPGVIIYSSAQIYGNYRDVVERGATIYILVFICLMIKSVLDSIDTIYRMHDVSKTRPIKGFLQVIEILVYIIVFIIIISVIIKRSPIAILSGIGALTAVYSLVFKDTIIGFVSGIQLTWNDMLRIGDWVEMPKYETSGDVIDITLNTVKVQNFDKTISTIPTYAFVSDSFKNWRGMKTFGARRMQRSINIDMTSVKICDEEMIERLKKVNLISNYINEKSQEIKKHNENIKNMDLNINGRRLTNIGVFRIYINNYLLQHNKISKNSPPMVRQLASSENGVPIEIYAFISDTVWANYEGIQGDIFDHILSVLNIFELKIFQNPTSYDINKIYNYNNEKITS